MERPQTSDGDAAADERLGTQLAYGMPVPRTPMYFYLRARTRFCDAEVLDALDAGFRQVVLVGAGYDGRPLRFRAPGVRYFEIDHPATQADKRERLAGLRTDLSNISFAAADFETDDVAGALSAAGLDPTAPALFVCEGVLVYLDVETIDRLLTALHTMAAPTSRLAISIGVLTNDPLREMRHRIRSSSMATLGEPWRTRLPRDDTLALLEHSGWTAVSVASPADFDDHARQSTALLIRAEPKL